MDIQISKIQIFRGIKSPNFSAASFCPFQIFRYRTWFISDPVYSSVRHVRLVVVPNKSAIHFLNTLLLVEKEFFERKVFIIEPVR